MLQIFKQLFSKKSQKSQERESILPRNRFADRRFRANIEVLELVASLMRRDATQRMVKVTELEFT